MYIKRLAVDLAKDVFQLYGIDDQDKQVVEKRIKSRQKFVEFVTILRFGRGNSSHCPPPRLEPIVPY